MQQVLFRLPIGPNGIPIYGFGAMLFCAFVACIWLATRRARKVGIAPEVIQDLALWIFGGGILGARVAYLLIVSRPPNLGAFLVALPQIWTGGIILYGGVIGAVLASLVGYAISFRKKENVTLLRLSDVVAPTVAVGLILGRLGCLLNGCCYGQVACASCPGVTFPLSAPPRSELTALGLQTAAGFLLESGRAQVTHVEIGSAAEESGLKPGDTIVELNGKEVQSAENVAKLLSHEEWERGENDLTLTVERDGKKLTLQTFQPRSLPLQPTQLYESISMLLLLLVLLAFDGVKRRDGQVIALMMVGYGLHRYFNEQLRIDDRPVGFEVYISVLLVVAGIGMMAWLSLGKQAPAPVAAQR